MEWAAAPLPQTEPSQDDNSGVSVARESLLVYHRLRHFCRNRIRCTHRFQLDSTTSRTGGAVRISILTGVQAADMPTCQQSEMETLCMQPVIAIHLQWCRTLCLISNSSIGFAGHRLRCALQSVMSVPNRQEGQVGCGHLDCLDPVKGLKKRRLT